MIYLSCVDPHSPFLITPSNVDETRQGSPDEPTGPNRSSSDLIEEGVTPQGPGLGTGDGFGGITWQNSTGPAIQRAMLKPL